jgi:hypothetical protein
MTKQTCPTAHHSPGDKPFLWQRDIEGVFDMLALEVLASEPGSGQPEFGPERPVAFNVVVWFEPG